MTIYARPFGKTPEGRQAEIFTLSNPDGLSAEITNLGGALVRLCVPGKSGRLSDVVLGYDTLEGYRTMGGYMGAVIGRHANRIEDARFTLNGREYLLCKNDGKNHLHGGLKGFDKVLWQPEIIILDGQESLRLRYFSPDGEENYPGNLRATVVYSFTPRNELVIEYFAVCDQDTVVNLTNHAYFNLKGHQTGGILQHLVFINADQFTAIDKEGVPTGEIRDVKGTPMDFTHVKAIGENIEADDEQIIFGKGYDHNFILKTGGKLTKTAVAVYEPESGRVMEVYTTKPGVQFYTGNFLNGANKGKGGAVYHRRSGFCLEAQYFPNALKHKNFPSPILKAGEEYRHTTVYKFSVKSD